MLWQGNNYSRMISFLFSDLSHMKQLFTLESNKLFKNLSVKKGKLQEIYEIQRIN